VEIAKRVRIYINDEDRHGHRSLAAALLAFLKDENAAGATLYRATEGFGASGDLHSSRLADVRWNLPLVIEWIDSPERVERLMPQVKGLVRQGLITQEDTEVVLHSPAPVRGIPRRVTVADVMSRDVAIVAPETPLQSVTELVVGKSYRALPVVRDGIPVGIITSGDLVARGGLGVRVELLPALDEAFYLAELERLAGASKTAADVMTPDPVTVPVDCPLAEAADRMARRRLKRLPVVDAVGRFAGIISRFDVLKTVAGGFPTADVASGVGGLRIDTPVSRVMRRDPPVVHADTPLPEVLQAVISTRLNRALVVDVDRRVVGLVSDAELLVRLTPSLHPGVLRSLMDRLPFASSTEEDRAERRHMKARSAADLMTESVATVPQDATVGDAIAILLAGSHKVAAVVDGDGRLAGILDRADLLHGLLQPERGG